MSEPAEQATSCNGSVVSGGPNDANSTALAPASTAPENGVGEKEAGSETNDLNGTSGNADADADADDPMHVPLLEECSDEKASVSPAPAAAAAAGAGADSVDAATSDAAGSVGAASSDVKAEAADSLGAAAGGAADSVGAASAAANNVNTTPSLSTGLTIEIPKPSGGTKRQLDEDSPTHVAGGGSPTSPRKSKRMRTQTPKIREAHEASMLQPTQDTRAIALLTPTQASAANSKLPKGFKFIPVTFDNEEDHAAFLHSSGQRSKRNRVVTNTFNFGTPAPATTPRASSRNKKSSKKPKLSEADSNRAEIAKKIALLQRRLAMLKRREAALLGTATPTSRRRSPALPGPLTPRTPGVSRPHTPGSSRRSHRVVKKPKFLVEENIPKLTEPLRKTLEVVNYLMKQPTALQMFNTPVDYVTLKIPDYPLIVKKPMDLGTVKANLLADVYTNINAVAEDVRLVWANAKKYNGEHHYVYQKAAELAVIFEQRFARVPLVEKPKPRPKPKTPRVGSGLKGAKTPRGGNQENSAMMETLQAMKKQMESLQKSITAKTPARKNMDKIPLNRREKEILRQDIFKLPSNKLGPVVEMCSQCSTGDDEEVEIDMDKLDIPTLRKLQQYVKRTKTRTPGRKKTPGKRTPGRKATPKGGKAAASSARPSSTQRRRTPGTSSPSMQSLVASSPRSLDQELGGGTMGAAVANATSIASKAMSDSSDSDSSSSSSSSDSDDDAVPKQPKKKAKTTKSSGSSNATFFPSGPPPSFGDASGMYGVSSSLAGGAVGGKGLGTNATASSQSKEREVIGVNNSAWGNLATAEESQKGGGVEKENSDNLWSSFQSQQQQQSEIDREREAREAKLKEEREREAEEMKQQAEEARERQQMEADLDRQRQEAEQAEAQKARDAERERARQARQQAPVLDLGGQNSLMDSFNNFG